MMKRFFALMALLPLAATPAHAQGAGHYAFRYDVYAGGVQAVAAQMDLAMADDAYKIDFTAQTRGFVGTVFPWQSHYSSEGLIGAAGLVPKANRVAKTERGTTKTLEMDFDADGQLVGRRETENQQDKILAPLEPGLADGAADLLTATLSVLRQAALAGGCGQQATVFDGSRRFALSTRAAGEVDLPSSDYSAYAGPALKCVLDIEPKGGHWRDRQLQWFDRAHGAARDPVIVWLARPVADGPLVPVRLQLKSPYGTALVHLAGSDLSDSQLAAQ